ncbi:conserved hypothetical protein [Myxococcus xanthus DK 1622]|uniref:Uncharacterized protein n=1 Tax=Myxococcus xanthus (strain DK1622) TaxID=246197 RepID=Q1DDI8_MYXXD|nr:conserved hypothetical protein [Myxococcus xanthus DK 1622]
MDGGHPGDRGRMDNPAGTRHARRGPQACGCRSAECRQAVESLWRRQGDVTWMEPVSTRPAAPVA